MEADETDQNEVNPFDGTIDNKDDSEDYADNEPGHEISGTELPRWQPRPSHNYEPSFRNVRYNDDTSGQIYIQVDDMKDVKFP